jgi:hypothetical protein
VYIKLREERQRAAEAAGGSAKDSTPGKGGRPGSYRGRPNSYRGGDGGGSGGAAGGADGSSPGTAPGGAGAATGEFNVGKVESSINPMFLTQNPDGSVGALAGALSPEKAHEAIMDTGVAELPTPELWSVFRTTYAGLHDQVSALQSQLSGSKAEAQKLMTLIEEFGLSAALEGQRAGRGGAAGGAAGGAGTARNPRLGKASRAEFGPTLVGGIPKPAAATEDEERSDSPAEAARAPAPAPLAPAAPTPDPAADRLQQAAAYMHVTSAASVLRRGASTRVRRTFDAEGGAAGGAGRGAPSTRTLGSPLAAAAAPGGAGSAVTNPLRLATAASNASMVAARQAEPRAAAPAPARAAEVELQTVPRRRAGSNSSSTSDSGGGATARRDPGGDSSV